MDREAIEKLFIEAISLGESIIDPHNNTAGAKDRLWRERQSLEIVTLKTEQVLALQSPKELAADEMFEALENIIKSCEVALRHSYSVGPMDLALDHILGRSIKITKKARGKS